MWSWPLLAVHNSATLRLDSGWLKQSTLYTLRKPLQPLLAKGVPSCEEPGSEQTFKISSEELPHPIKQSWDELRKRNFFVSLPLRCRLLILVDFCAEWGWPYTLGIIQGERLLVIFPSQYYFYRLIISIKYLKTSNNYWVFRKLYWLRGNCTDLKEIYIQNKNKMILGKVEIQ